MMTKIIKFKSTQSELHQQSMQIRMEVFVEEQNVPAELEHEYETESTHFLLFENQQALATARYRSTEKGIKFERFAVRASHRNRGLGFKILRYMLTEVLPLRQRIYLHAQVNVVSFYKRNGFIICGSKFTEAGIEHYPMEYDNEEQMRRALTQAVCRR